MLKIMGKNILQFHAEKFCFAKPMTHVRSSMLISKLQNPYRFNGQINNDLLSTIEILILYYSC